MGTFRSRAPAVTFPPIKKATVLEKLVAEVRAQISARALVPGQALPTEARMAADFGVSRPLLREALAQLRTEGFVETLPGKGTFVRQPSERDLAEVFSRQLAASPELFTVDHLYEARQAIEVVAAELAATRATPEAVSTLRSLLQAMEDARDEPAAFTAADVGFHVAVARASANPLLPTLLSPIATIIVKGVFQSHAHEGAVLLGIKAHREVLKAIESGQPEAARRAMARHLQESRSVFPVGLTTAPGEPRS